MLAPDSKPSMLLRQPGQIGPLSLKNRVVMGPMGTNFGTTDGFSTERDKIYYAERARGGAAMIITEAMVVSGNARNHRASLCIFDDRFIPGLADLTKAIHQAGALVCGQLNHRGMLLRRSVLGMEPVGPSPGKNPATGDEVRALSRHDIAEIEEQFLSSAVRLYRAGYDAVELHAANGYLFQQFFTPRHNRREDEYGGSVENRMRLLMETVALIRSELPDFPMMVRLSATEYVDGGYSVDDVVALSKALEAAGVVAIDLSGGTNETPELSRYCIQPPSFPRRFLEPYARPIKDAVSVPVIMAGRMLTPEDAEGVLQAGSADYIALCRALVADPHWCLKAFGEVKRPIRHCISCNVCFERLTLELDVACVQNPLVGTEFETLAKLEPGLEGIRKQDGRVLVIGGGVAGLEAARVFAMNGREVEVWEREPRAGGQIDLALAAPDKEDVSGVWTYRMASLDQLDVPIRTGVEPTLDRIRAYAPDLIVIATGASPRDPPFPVNTNVPLLQAWDVLRQPELIPEGANITVVGGGMVGIETAECIAKRASHVTILEGQSVVAKEMARNNRWDVLLRLREANAQIMTDVPVISIEGDSILCRGGQGVVRHPAGDRIVLAIGARPVRDVAKLADEAGVPWVMVGDCNNVPGDFLTAIRDASMIAWAAEERFPAAPGKVRATS
ncbi:MAG TPA: FAD-dependent oxidoreductase [Bradyrhizobium sp.]|jgi:2,4-dienoyl-CoA reductase-like NADH-dependent reductase (Old Yellow Enzyme family)/thioredoxin reductase|nr:FAD-dependent oxidoreductase [Bradyrhizobium sp.]